MYNHCINKLLNIEDVIVKKVEHADTFTKIYLETKPKEHICPFCHAPPRRVHDYRSQVIKDLPFQLKHCYLVLRKRRYHCSCGKHFYESYSFLPRYFQRINRLTAYIASSLHTNLSMKDVALQVNVSASTVASILDSISYSRQKLPEAISIDEFKGNATTDKYHCIRQVTWAIEGVRKRLQRSMLSSLRKYYKRSRKLILTRYFKLKEDDKEAVILCCFIMMIYEKHIFSRKSFMKSVKIPSTLSNEKTFFSGLNWLRIPEYQNSRNVQEHFEIGPKKF